MCLAINMITTVAQLIELLQKQPQNAVVIIADYFNETEFVNFNPKAHLDCFPISDSQRYGVPDKTPCVRLG